MIFVRFCSLSAGCFNKSELHYLKTMKSLLQNLLKLLETSKFEKSTNWFAYDTANNIRQNVWFFLGNNTTAGLVPFRLTRNIFFLIFELLTAITINY